MTVQDQPRPALSRSRWRWAAHALAMTVLALVVAGALLTLAVPDGVTAPSGDSVPRYGWTQITLAVPFLAAGWLLATRRPEVPFGWLALAAAVAHAGAAAGGGWAMAAVYGGHDLPGVIPVAVLTAACEATEPLVLVTTWATFPGGRFPRGRIRWFAAVSVGLCAVGWLSAPLGDFELVDPPPAYATFANPIGVSFPAWLPVLLFASGLLLGSVVMVARWLRAEGELRQVLRWLAVVNAIGIVLTPFVVALPAGALIASVGTVVQLVVVVAVVLARRVYGIEVVLNRTLVYVLLTAFVAAVYAAGVAVLAAFGQAVGGPWPAVAALAAAFSLAPARSRVQRVVNRFLYGERDDPYTVVARVAARLESAGSVDALLPSLLDALTGTLRLPRATVELRGDDGSVRAISSGKGREADRSARATTARFPLVHQGEDIGALVVRLRSGQNALSPRETRLLTDIARQVAVAASNVRLTEALTRSRERIVGAAEEERRRLRRDLHDGLGPTLTAAATKVDAARNLAGRDLPRATNLLADVRHDLTSALGELRRLVYALRPPALDELGLLAALRETLRGAAVPVTLTAPDALPPLPAAVEVAAYRIVTEAVTNVAKHTGATRCEVTIDCAETLTVEIRDDGHASGSEGTATTWTPGVGLTSMRERAMALGGTWSAGPAAGGGQVLVELPLSLAGSAVPRAARGTDASGITDLARFKDAMGTAGSQLAGSAG
ncbi:sensor histidine kinase [Frankia sp. CNm7]|uniref:Sensor histidine kinase n=1 Tax=Frankia nepalensis TaxID=1836974 RepID=A0A937RMD1_9ACTN|nr:sensor histidine kinase [Frankia nepalensis]MBL7514553.1 sensor histidine kinase [Frankia nepalensis]MBL7524400.1 sensor histidine kinase [Frankia nepalensis]MBL7631459.1 sensor histidine kinase [Frankia nepalensis]